MSVTNVWNQMYKDSSKQGVILFVHGLGGSAKGTWSNLMIQFFNIPFSISLFPKFFRQFLTSIFKNRIIECNFPYLIEKDSELSQTYSVASYEYPTALFKSFFFCKVPSVEILAEGLKTKIDNAYQDYQHITLLCHSLGGLVARQYLLNEIKKNRIPKVKKLILFATPNNGSDLASPKGFFRILRIFTLQHRQIQQLRRDSTFLHVLNEDWATFNLKNYVDIKYIYGDLDRVVNPISAKHYWGNSNCECVTFKNHRNIVKPKDETDLGFIIAKEFIFKSFELPISNSIVKFDQWIEKKRKNSIEFIKTKKTSKLIKKINSTTLDSPIQCIIVGDIGSGKSTLAKEIGINFLKSSQIQNPKIVVLPLTREFQLEEDWSKQQSCEGFNNYLFSILKSPNRETLFIVEDAHEGEGIPGHLWTGNSNKDASLIPIIVTTRPNKLKEVKTRLNKNWSILEPLIFQISPDDTAKAIVSYLSVPQSIQNQIIEMYHKCGRNLVVLEAIIDAWKRSDNGGALDMNLAYRAVYEEIDRIASQRGLDENIDNRLTITIIWIIGGLAISIDKNFIETEFNIHPKEVFWQQLKNANEISIDQRKKYFSLRHPAWGLLVLQAMDKYRSLRSLGDHMRNGFKKTIQYILPPEKTKEIHKLKPSECLMIALLRSEAISPKELGFYCSGKAIHDEFITAASFYMDILLNDVTDELLVSGILIDIAESVRRSNAENPIQRQIIIKKGYAELQRAFRIRKNHFGEQFQNDPAKGNLFYQAAYYKYLMGDLKQAVILFEKSKLAEIDTGDPERLPFAAMSGARESITLTYLNELDNAKKIIDESLNMIESERPSKKKSLKRWYRFRGNVFHGYIELYIAKKDTTNAKKYIDFFKDDYEAADLDVNDFLYNARICLIHRQGEEAENLIIKAFEDMDLATKAEKMISIYRVFGDALLMQDKKDKAIEAYKKVLPPSKKNESRYLDFELKLIDERYNKIINGDEPNEIFKEARF